MYQFLFRAIGLNIRAINCCCRVVYLLQRRLGYIITEFGKVSMSLTRTLQIATDSTRREWERLLLWVPHGSTWSE